MAIEWAIASVVIRVLALDQSNDYYSVQTFINLYLDFRLVAVLVQCCAVINLRRQSPVLLPATLPIDWAKQLYDRLAMQ